MQNCLRAAGINPKNNLVDITNFVLFELGQPLHAFDASKIEGREVVVRTCPEGTPFVTLDGVERKLTDKDLMICSAERPMCIAGVFGGLDSGVSDTTTDVFIESAYFNPVWVRKTAKRFGLNTDASFRFERGIDPNMQVYAAKRAALLMKELAGGTISSDITDICPEPVGDFVFDLSLARVDALIGKPIPEATVRTIIAALEVKILAERDGVLTVAVPPYRVDVQREADLIEDILRIYGYNNVEIPMQVRSTLSYAPKPDRNRLMNLAADFLTANGFTEIMSNSLTKAAYYEGLTSCPAERCVRILNPLSADLNVMRQTLLFNMLEAVGLNANRRNGDLCLYEFGNCYFYDESKRTEENRLAAYSEEYRLAIAVTGVSTPQSWNAKPVKASFFTLRAVAEKLLRRFGIDIYALKTETLESDLFSEGLSLSLGGKELLQIGSVAPAIRRRTDVKQDVYYLEMNFDALVKSTKKLKIAAGGAFEIPRGPARPGAAGGQVRDLLLAARRGLRRRTQAAEKRLVVRCLRGRQTPRGQEILRFEFHSGGQDPHAGRADHRACDVEPHPAVRAEVRRAGPGLTNFRQPKNRPAPSRAGRFSINTPMRRFSRIFAWTTPLFVAGAVLFFTKAAALPFKVAYPVLLLGVSTLLLRRRELLPFGFAFLFSAAGDAVGAKGLFIPQMAFFALAHAAYVCWFLPRAQRTPRAASLAVTVPLLVFLFRRHRPRGSGPGRTYRRRGLRAGHRRDVLFGASVRRAHAAGFRCAALLFVFSDAVIAWNRFIGPVPARTWVIMTTYYLAQYLFFRFAVKTAIRD